jgi:hypothetical protein
VGKLNHGQVLRNASEQEHRKQVDLSCAAWSVYHKQGAMYWLRNCTKAENYPWKEQGLNPVAPFPYKPWAKGTHSYST